MNSATARAATAGGGGEVELSPLPPAAFSRYRGRTRPGIRWFRPRFCVRAIRSAYLNGCEAAPSYSGLVRCPLTAVTRVRIPLGSPDVKMPRPNGRGIFACGARGPGCPRPHRIRQHRTESDAKAFGIRFRGALPNPGRAMTSAVQPSRAARRCRTTRRTPHTTAQASPATTIHGSRNPMPMTTPFSVATRPFQPAPRPSPKPAADQARGSASWSPVRAVQAGTRSRQGRRGLGNASRRARGSVASVHGQRGICGGEYGVLRQPRATMARRRASGAAPRESVTVRLWSVFAIAVGLAPLVVVANLSIAASDDVSASCGPSADATEFCEGGRSRQAIVASGLVSSGMSRPPSS